MRINLKSASFKLALFKTYFLYTFNNQTHRLTKTNLDKTKTCAYL